VIDLAGTTALNWRAAGVSRLVFRANTPVRPVFLGRRAMICPDCGYDNIDGIDICDGCGQPLVQFDQAGTKLEQTISRHSIDVLVPKTPVLVSSSMSTRDAIGEMMSRKFGCLLVEENGELVGVFTERDVLNKVSCDLATNLERPVSDFMTPSPETLTSRDSIAYALHAMDVGGYRHLPVVDENGNPQGIVSVRDILRFLCIKFGQLRSQAP
jgi:CBS domain-containing protein